MYTKQIWEELCAYKCHLSEKVILIDELHRETQDSQDIDFSA